MGQYLEWDPAIPDVVDWKLCIIRWWGQESKVIIPEFVHGAWNPQRWIKQPYKGEDASLHSYKLTGKNLTICTPLIHEIGLWESGYMHSQFMNLGISQFMMKIQRLLTVSWIDMLSLIVTLDSYFELVHRKKRQYSANIYESGLEYVKLIFFCH